MNQPAANTAGQLPATLADFMAQALQMELDAQQRYSEFADMMEIHNNLEVAQWFRKMAAIEGKHAQQIMDQMGWRQAPPMALGAPVLEGFEAPETAAVEEVHYLMRPWHVLQLALANEERAQRFFSKLASLATVDAVRQAALALQQEEARHVQLVKAWMAKVPQPQADWDQDPDPPRYDD